MYTPGDFFFPPQDAKHKDTKRQLYVMGCLFDRKYSQWGYMCLLITEAYLGPSRNI